MSIQELELIKLMMEIDPKTTVKEVKKSEVILQNDVVIPFGLCVWSTGNTPTDFIKTLTVPKDRTGRVRVDQYLRVKGETNIFGIGDCATREEIVLPQTAQ